ncbi:hypothetical protein [Pyrolobus fumarii]|uniref:hypothetical protein n=1 Tax=Pyrolobus fumarii TaxID=54252 RepID=UPI00064FB0F6|nr:hypothetical protein [Pyrolobus fumarii]
MTQLLTIAVANTDYNTNAYREALEVLDNIASGYAERVSLPSRLHKPVVTSLSDVEIVEVEARRYTAILIVAVTGRTARLIYNIGVRAERPVILVSLESSDALPDVLEAYTALRKDGYGVSKPIIYPRDKHVLDNYMIAAEVLGRHKGAAYIHIGSVVPWSLYGAVNESRVRMKLNSTILKMDLNDVVARLEAVPREKAEKIAEQLESRGIRFEVGTEEVVKAARLYVALKKIARDNHAVALSVNCAELNSRLDTSAYLASTLLQEYDNIPLTCDSDVTAAVTASLLAPLTPIGIGKPIDIRDDGTAVYALHTPPLSLLKEASVAIHPRENSVVIRGAIDWRGRVHVVRLDPDISTLHVCECSVESSEATPLTTVRLSGCSCVLDIPGSQHILAFNVNRETLGALAELLGLRMLAKPTTDTN